MSEYRQENTNRVSPEEYDRGKLFRATIEDLVGSIEISKESEDQERGQFTLRLLENDRSSATDQLVELVSADPLTDDGFKGPIFLTMRHVLPNGDSGPRFPRTLSSDSFVLNDNPSPNFERGYILGGEGVGKEKLREASESNEFDDEDDNQSAEFALKRRIPYRPPLEEEADPRYYS